MFPIEHRLEYGKLATFSPNRKYPIYRWFHYKEAFARDLVVELLENWKPKRVLDPFCGVGTTCLAAKELGIDSVGIDVLPLALFVSKVKTRDYDVDEVKKWADFLLKQRPGVYSTERIRDPLVKKAFLPKTLGMILWYKDFIQEKIEPTEVRDLFTLALITASQKCSFAFKDGAVIKIIKRPVPPIRNVLKREIKKFILDIEAFPKTGAQARIIEGDARAIPLADEYVDAVITSPPYLNKIEYTQVYRIEHAIFFPKRPLPPLKSYVGMDLDNIPEGWEQYPLPARAYFADMKKVLEEIFRVLKPGGNAAIVVGNAYFPDHDLIIDVDIELAKIARDVGFKVRKIVVLNERWATKKRTIKRGKVRESLVLLRKL